MFDDLKGKHIVITGASSGIGRHAAIGLSKYGAKLFLTARNGERLQQTLNECEPGDHHFEVCDLDDPDRLTDLIKDAAKSYGPFGAAFHAAGSELIAPITIMNEKRLLSMFKSSTFAFFAIAKALQKKGVIVEGTFFSFVTMSSVAALRGQSGMTGYCATKSAIEGAVRALAVELASKKFRVNSIVAGAVQTEMHDRISSSLGVEGIQKYEGKHLLGFGELIDITNAATFLLSNASKWITGSSMLVDGGYSCR